MVGVTYGSPRRSAIWAMPASGARRLRSTSAASALSGDTYSTRQRRALGGSDVNISRSRQQRKAASVFPLPVGERMSVESPRAIAGQPAVCGAVGAWNALLNHARTAGWNGSSGSVFERAVTTEIL